MSWKHCPIFALLGTFALSWACLAQPVGTVEQRGHVPAEKRHRFGNEWDGQRPDAIIPLVGKIERLVDEMQTMPARIERAFWYGGFACGVLAFLAVDMVLFAVVYQLKK